MEEFKDINGSTVRLAFGRNAFPKPPIHILVVCRYGDKWLLTDHKQRGWEFPGGKMEDGETLEEAAAREVFEETGAILKHLMAVGEYEVDGKFVKRIYYGEVKELQSESYYHETNGPVFEEGDLLKERLGSHYSFIMKDEVIDKAFQYLKEAGMI
ncbi:RNA deprotection pyrophosphohydrolase [Bacillus sp. T33-2]|uniref:RNA deprotection pyrophosphohydrolase n=1 Tax=Bacillus sp. T33-2 TaxID=2054168 RepID=UPI000C76C029|nr:nucleoside triphosphatase YtkD [Bacillus sp. T33-2]PLR98242.1 nucleoside triphosphatase YtkD [Bacillus sp. T33-2]